MMPSTVGELLVQADELTTHFEDHEPADACVVSWLLRVSGVMTSETRVGWTAWGESRWSSCRKKARLIASPKGHVWSLWWRWARTARTLDVTRQHVGVLHEARAILADSRVYSTRVGRHWPTAGSTPRGWGANVRHSGVLHEGPGLVQYAQPLASTPPPSCSSRPEGAPAGRGPLLEHHQEPRGHQQELSEHPREPSNRHWGTGEGPGCPDL